MDQDNLSSLLEYHRNFAAKPRIVAAFFLRVLLDIRSASADFVVGILARGVRIMRLGLIFPLLGIPVHGRFDVHQESRHADFAGIPVRKIPVEQAKVSRRAREVSAYLDAGTADERSSNKQEMHSQTGLRTNPGFEPGTCRAEPENNDCTCNNEGDFATGNHCMKISGAALAKFEKDTDQDFPGTHGTNANWCVCLHLWATNGRPAGESFS